MSIAGQKAYFQHTFFGMSGRFRIYSCLSLHNEEMRFAERFVVQTEAIWSF